MASIEEHDTVQVQFVCRDCRDGRHGCARAWKGIGLKISCCCNCGESPKPSITITSATREVDDAQ
jgi:hypothetical protein